MLRAQAAQAKPAVVKPAEPNHVAATRPPLKPTLSGSSTAAAEPKAGLVSGAQPIVSTNSFESRFSAVR